MTQTPKECRSGRKCEPRTLKEAVDCLAHHSALSLPQICERSGLDYNRMAKACSLYEARVPRTDELLALTINSADDPRDRNLVVMRYLAGQLNLAVVTLPAITAEHPEFFGAMTATTERLSGLGRELHESVRNDGQVDGDELARIEACGQAMHEAVATVVGMARAAHRAAAQQVPPLRAIERREA
jgi:hypothetical protein